MRKQSICKNYSNTLEACKITFVKVWKWSQCRQRKGDTISKTNFLSGNPF